MTQSQILLKLSLSYQSLLEAITSLELREMIQLKRLLDQKIQEALAKYEGTDDLILDEIERQHPAYEIAMTQAVLSALDESENQKFANESEFHDWLISISD